MRTTLAILTASLLLVVGCATSKTKPRSASTVLTNLSAVDLSRITFDAVTAQTTYSLTPTSATASSAGSTGNIALTVPTWTATSDSSWLSISPTSGQGNASFVWTAAANTSTAVRTGTLNIAGQLFTVTQDGATGGGPVNNFFANATIISGSTATVTGSNVGATKEPGEPNHAGNAGGKSVWWTWTAPVSGSATINTRNSSFDTTLGVYTGSSVSTLGGIAGNDDSGGTLQSSVTFNAVAGITYRIAVDGYNGSSGSITLSITSVTTGCIYSISPTMVSIPAGSFTGNISVTAGPGCTWTAISGASWITTSSSGTGNGIASYLVQQNTGAARANTLTIAGKTFTVNQAAAGGGGAAGQYQWSTNGVVSGTANPKGIATDSAGNVVAVGTFMNGLDFGTGNLPYLGGKDNFIFKYDVHGQPLWAKSIGNKVDDDIRGVAIDSAGNIIVTGSFQGTTDFPVDFGGTVLTPSGPVIYPSVNLIATPNPSLGNFVADIFVAKYSSSGALVWVKQFGGTSSDSGMGVVLDKTDNIYLAAQVNSPSIVFGTTTLNNPPNGPAVFAKLRGDGSVAWAKGWAVSEVGAPRIAVDKFGDLVVGGSYVGTANFGGSSKTANGYDIFMAKYSGADGTWKWDKTMGGSSSDYAYGMATDPSTGNVIITGLFGSTMDFGGGPITDYSGNIGVGGIYIAAYGPSSNYLWAKTPNLASGGFNAQDNGNGVVVDENGNIYCSGAASTATIYFGGGTPLTGGNDYWVTSLTSTGVKRWAKRASGANSGGGPIVVDAFGHLLVTGAINSGMVYFDGLLGAAGGSATTGLGLTAPFVIQYSK